MSEPFKIAENLEAPGWDEGSGEKAEAVVYVSDRPVLDDSASRVATVELPCSGGDLKGCVLKNIDVLLQQLADKDVDLTFLDDYKYMIVKEGDSVAVLSNPLNPEMVAKMKKYLMPMITAKCRAAVLKMNALSERIAELEAEVEEATAEAERCRRALNKCKKNCGGGDFMTHMVEMVKTVAPVLSESERAKAEMLKYQILAQNYQTVQRQPADPTQIAKTIKTTASALKEIAPLLKELLKKEEKGDEEKGGDGW